MKYIYRRALQARDLLEEIIKYFEGQNLMESDRASPEDSNVSESIYPDFETDMDGNILQPEGIDPDFIIDIIEQRKKSAHGGVQTESARADKEGENSMPTLKEGSITKRKDGRWMGRYQDHGIQRSVYAGSKIDIINKVNDCVVARNRQFDDERRGVAKKVTLSEFIDVWFSSWKVATSRTKPLSARTIGFVESTVIKYVRDHKLAKNPILKITPDDIDTILNDIPTRYLQGRTYGYLRLVFEKAIQKDIITKNPYDRIDKRAVPTAKKKIMPDIETWLQFIDWLEEQSIETYYLAKFLASTGLRIGEAISLTWKDIDFATMRISVSKSFSISTQTLVNHPKTDAGIRRVPIFPDAYEVLENIPKEKKPNEVFWFLSKWVCAKQFTRYVRRFGKFELTVHGLRHFFASLCRANGIDKKTYSRWMGHENVAMTDDYTHEISEFEQEQIAKMAKLSLKKQ